MSTSKLKLAGFLFALFFILLTAFNLQLPDSKKVHLDQLEKDIPLWLEEFIVPGAAIALIENGEIILQKGYGYADLQNKIKVDNQTGFNIASISKTVSAWGVMKLVDEGKIDLDDPVEKHLTRWHLPPSEFDVQDVTIRRLLSHTAGLSLHGYPGYAPEDELPSIEESLSGKTNGSGGVELVMEAGIRWQYSGGGYTLLQLVIEEVTGRSFAEYMQAEVLNPLGMKNSSFNIDEKIMTASSLEHNSYGEVIPFELFTAQAAAGLHTTIEDLTLFALASLGTSETSKAKQSILKPNTLDLMTYTAPAASGRYGLGYSIESYPEHSVELVGHGGSNDGWQSYLQVNRKTGDGFIMITNGGAGRDVYQQAYCKWMDWNYDISLGNRCKKSIAPLLINTYKKEGIDATINTYNDVRKNRADEYRFSEGNLNLFGYELMWADQVKESIEIFKLVIREYPNSFNAYDSYGEALLVDGNEALGIENYIKSVKMNPGNKNAIRILDRLGVNTDTLVVTVPIEKLKLLEGMYVSEEKRRPSDGEWIITVKEVNGQLYGKDMDYKYQLIPVSENEFVNPDDGAKLIFDTTDENDISFIIFGHVKFRKTGC